MIMNEVLKDLLVLINKKKDFVLKILELYQNQNNFLPTLDHKSMRNRDTERIEVFSVRTGELMKKIDEVDILIKNGMGKIGSFENIDKQSFPIVNDITREMKKTKNLLKQISSLYKENENIMLSLKDNIQKELVNINKFKITSNAYTKKEEVTGSYFIDSKN